MGCSFEIRSAAAISAAEAAGKGQRGQPQGPATAVWSSASTTRGFEQFDRIAVDKELPAAVRLDDLAAERASVRFQGASPGYRGLPEQARLS
jgi:hypothetical protein